MSSPPRTPTQASPSRPRRPSNQDLDYPYTNTSSVTTTPAYNHQSSHSRRSSGISYSPSYRRRSSTSFAAATTPSLEFHADLGGGGGGDAGGGGGLGSLADELAEAWDDDEYDEGHEGHALEAELEQAAGDVDGLSLHDQLAAESARDSGIAIESSPSSAKGTLSPSRGGASGGVSRRHRRDLSLYDGSDYGDDSDLDMSEGISAGLEARMAAVEGLARRGLEMNGSEADMVVPRLTEMLKDLGNQAALEGGASRLTTAHSALSTHLQHQTRLITSLTSTIFSPLSMPLFSAEDIDAFIPLIETTLTLLPHPASAPLHSLAALSSSTADLLTTLSYVSDTLHMSRQTTTLAARRLRTVTDALAEWKKEHDEREEGIHWIEQGDWERRIREREAKRVCGDVVGGFEEVCGGLRARLVEGLGVASA